MICQFLKINKRSGLNAKIDCCAEMYDMKFEDPCDQKFRNYLSC